MKVVVKLEDVIKFLEGGADNTDTDPYWKAATSLRKVPHYDLMDWVIEGRTSTWYFGSRFF